MAGRFAVPHDHLRQQREDWTERGQRARQVALSVRGIFGGFWTNDAAGQDMIDGTTLAAGGAPIDGPGDGFEVDGLWSVGAGFDARLGEHWLIGIATTFARMFGHGARSLEGGLHISYGWGKVSEDDL